jgi:methyl-accepting chemotaxis protein
MGQTVGDISSKQATFWHFVLVFLQNKCSDSKFHGIIEIYPETPKYSLFGGIMSKKISRLELLEKIKHLGRKSNAEEPAGAPRAGGKGQTDFKSVVADLTTTRSILSKLVAMFLLLIIIPLTTIGFISTKTASKNLTVSAEESVKNATMQTSSYFDVFLDKAKNISIQLIANSAVQKLSNMNDATDDYDRLTAQQEASNALSSINTAITGMDCKLIYNSGFVLGNLTPPENMEKVFVTDWYKKVSEADGSSLWIDCDEGLRRDGSTGYALSMVRLYKSTIAGKPTGIIIVDVNYAPVQDILESINLGKKDSSYLLTPYGRVLSVDGYSENEKLVGRQFVKDVQKRLETADEGVFYTTDNGVKYLVSYHKSEATELTAITIAPNSAIVAGASQIMKTTILFGLVFAIIAVVVGFIFSLGLTLSMKSIMGVMLRAEEGDLTVSLGMKRRDEIGKLVEHFNNMLVRIRGLVVQNKQAAQEVVASSGKMALISSESSQVSSEIARAIVEVATGSSNQAAEIEDSVKNVSQLADRITSAVEKTKVMESDSDSMRELSDIGIRIIGNLNEKSARTNEITSKVVTEIAQLNKFVKNINVITKVLGSIADQTNLLALNAAIEAARAGDAGKGFAVVAEEIRKLAEQSNNHTRDIQKHIEEIFKQTQSSTDLVMQAETSIKEQSDMVGQTAQAFERINETTRTLGENISKVGGMIKDMDSFKQKVIASMENISAVSEQVSASSEEVSASTEEQLASIEQLDSMSKQLNDLAANLIEQMEKFKV